MPSRFKRGLLAAEAANHNGIFLVFFSLVMPIRVLRTYAPGGVHGGGVLSTRDIVAI